MHINCRDLTERRNDQLDMIILDVLQSSAYNYIQFPGITTSGKSLMKVTKNKGPDKEPCGMPDGIAHHVELIPSMTTPCSRSVRAIMALECDPS